MILYLQDQKSVANYSKIQSERMKNCNCWFYGLRCGFSLCHGPRWKDVLSKTFVLNGPQENMLN